MDQLRSDQDKVDRIILAAELANFAYTSANPTASISVDDDEARRSLHDSLGVWGSAPHNLGLNENYPGHFARFASHSWWRRKENQFRWFRSHAYIYDYFEQQSNVHRIVVAFRGTWNNDSVTNEWYSHPDENRGCWARCGPPAWYNWLTRKLTPANIGLSDFYYDIMVIRIPYTSGTVWKWFAYWGALVLQRTNWCPFQYRPLSWLVHPARMVAADWISRPNHNRTGQTPETQLGDVHLGFWSLWASPEGFGGYDVDGNLPETEPGLILKVRTALDRCQDVEKATEILVVGHSLGGAVSCFAALDLARRLIEWDRKDVGIFHVSLGAPPVGDARFQNHFNNHFNRSGDDRLQSWSIFHERDAVASFFAFLGSKWLVGRLGWWGDWRGVGHRVILRSRIQDLPSAGGAGAPPDAPPDEPLPHNTTAADIPPDDAPPGEAPPEDPSLDDVPSADALPDDAPLNHTLPEDALPADVPPADAPPRDTLASPWWRTCCIFFSKAGQGLLTGCKLLLEITGVSWLLDKLAKPLLFIAILVLLVLLFILSFLAVLVAIRYYLGPWYWCFHRRNVTKPSERWGPRRPGRDPPPRVQGGGSLGFEYHSLQRYIELIRRPDFLSQAELVVWVDGIGEEVVAREDADQREEQGKTGI